jgi:hypothetical protein
MFNSAEYWDKRYKLNATSGSGSYGQLAQYKSDVINNFISENVIHSILDYGVGDGNQLSLLNVNKYTGIDISDFIIKKCKEQFKHDISKKFFNVNEFLKNVEKHDLAISCDVLYHLIEDNVYYEYLKNLFVFSKKYVIIYAADIDYNETIHVKFRKFTDYIKTNFKQWKLVKEIKNKYLRTDIKVHKDNQSPSNFYIYKKYDIFVSVTSLFQNQRILLKTLNSLKNQTTLPDKIFLYLSEEPYLKDLGFKNKNITNTSLKEFIDNNSSLIEVRFVSNIGSYRKLLPLLEEKWDEDCVIITVDDDTVYTSDLISKYINDYEKYKCAVSYRGFTPNCISLEDFDYLNRLPLVKLHKLNFSTGKGGVLYHPSFFHKIGKIIFEKDYFLKLCETHDDVWFNFFRILNDVPCYCDDTQPYMIEDLYTDTSLYINFNQHNNKDRNYFKNIYKKIKDII